MRYTPAQPTSAGGPGLMSEQSMSDRAHRSRLRRLAAASAAVGALGLGVGPGAAREEVAGFPGPAGPVLELARRQELERLEVRIGRFVSGAVAVYAGTLEATEHRAGREERRLPEGRVVAALEEHERLPGGGGPGVSLTVVSVRHGLWLRLDQPRDEPGVTRSTLLRPILASPGITGSCRGCLADFSRRPRTLRLERFAAAGRLRDARGTGFRVELAGRLEPVPPAELALSDLEALDPGLEPRLRDEDRDFTPAGGEGVLRVERRLRQRVPPPAGAPPAMRCDRVVRYAAERFVDLADLSRFGVRELRILGTEICCLNHDLHGEAERCTAEAGG